MLRGSLVDAAANCVLLAPAAVAIVLGSGRWLRRPRLRALGLWVASSAAVFGAFVEYCFFEEFDARFNHIALDYLLYPDEVATNVWQSYPVPLFLAIALAAGAALAWWITRVVGEGAFAPRRSAARVACAGGIVAVGAAACLALSQAPEPPWGDRRTSEIGKNGVVELVRAFRSASLPYADYYATVPVNELRSDVLEDLGPTPPGDPGRAFRAVERRERPLDIVVILGESFGSEFVGCLKGDRPCAPGFDRWSREGILLSNVIATGNRTVRGLEGVLCSFVPLPGDSIWKRDKSNGVASLANVLRAQGYRTEFVYGGAGAFDSMRSFALRNGWESFVEDGLVGESSYPEDAFRTAWGVADEHLFTELLARQRAAHRDGVPYFATALTTSNHKPYLTPDPELSPVRKKSLSAALPGAIGLFLASVFAWRWLATRVGRMRLGVLIGVSAFLFVASAWSDTRPRGSREGAVRYADRALADYLDAARAEGILDHTIVLFVGDHGARVYGAEEIPAESYRVPALFLAPDAKYRGRRIERLCSQVDLAPTLLSLAGIDHAAPFFGRDLLALPDDGPGRAWLIHNRSIGLLTDEALLVLGLRKTKALYVRENRDSDRFVPATGEHIHTLGERAAAVFQLASTLYEQERYRLRDAP
jgi:phosphoglycerol transferase MdoB-like AlkP superfamily enzyme